MMMRIVDQKKFFIRVGVLLIIMLAVITILFNEWISQEVIQPEIPTYTIQVYLGDTLWSLAEHHMKEGDIRSFVQKIIQINGLSADGTIHAGQSLKLPIQAGEILQADSRH